MIWVSCNSPKSLTTHTRNRSIGMADRDPTDLIKEINQNLLPNELAKYLAVSFPELKESEVMCFHYVSYGYTNERIAELMGKSVWTIKDYVSSLLTIFEVKTRVDLRVIYSCRINASIFLSIATLSKNNIC